jgi:hypothetical protein
MIARYLSKENAKIYAGKLARIYGPDVRFDVVCLPDPFFDNPVWYVLGSGTVAGKSFAEYAAPPREYHLEADDEQGSVRCNMPDMEIRAADMEVNIDNFTHAKGAHRESRDDNRLPQSRRHSP